LFKIDIDFWQEILSTFRSNKLRTGLTAAGVFWGIFMLILMMGIGKGMENGVLSEFGGTASNGLFIWPGKTSIAQKGMPINRTVNFYIEDVDDIKQKVAAIDLIAPRVELGAQTVVRENEKGSYEVRGELPAVFSIQSMIPIEGRILNELDEKEKRKNAVIGKKVAAALFRTGSPIGKYISINSIPFQVVGVVAFDGQGQWMQEIEEQVFIPLSSCRQAFNFANKISWFVCTVKPEYDIEKTELEIKGLLAQKHKVHPDDKQGIGSFNSHKEFGRIASLFSSIDIFIWFVGFMTLFAGIVSVSNVMLITVKDRTREFGLRKAIGATPNSIIRMIITESVVLTTVSGYVGLLIGTGLIALVNYLISASGGGAELFKNPEIEPQIALGALMVLIVSGAIAGLLPARYAVKIQPVEALRAD
jgi:putative ABC transport system permease protein